MDDSADNVVQLVQPKSEEEKLLNVAITDRKSAGQKYCKHNQTQISEANRTLICLQCGSMLDPFEVILDRARNGENIVFEIKSLYAKRDELRESVANLEREEKNAKARLRSVKTSILFAENDLKDTEQGVKR
ncbi:hypothetical protein [Enterobacter sp. ECC-019]|uniref:hypothetical protein n=1 Tax=Enterobacter sp. ECC-019 TaxID=3116478 RepID=UPI0037546766